MKGTATVGARRHLVTLQNPSGPPTPDGDGGYTQIFTDLSPARWYGSIEPATARDLERVASGTVISGATHILRGRFHSGVTTKTRITFNGRTLNVTGVANLEERSIDMEIVAVEVVQ